jgi:spore germination protein (amino acid permease)
MILLSCGSASIINAIYIGIIAIILTFIIVKLYKNFVGKDIIDISQFLGGNVLKNIISIFLICYILLLSATFIRDFCELIHILYYANTPVFYILLFFIVIAIISNYLGEHTIIKTNLFLCIIMLISLVLSFLLVFPNITVERIFPILGYGTYQTFFSGLIDVFSFNGLILLYLIPPMLSEQTHKNFSKICMISIVITAFLILFATASLLLSFSFSTQIETVSPLYLLIANNQFGEYFQHPESLFVFTWILSFMTYLNIAVLFIVRILKKLTAVKNSKAFIIPVCIVLFILALIPKSIMQVRTLSIFTCKYIAGPTVFILLPFILILANIKHKKII